MQFSCTSFPSTQKRVPMYTGFIFIFVYLFICIYMQGFCVHVVSHLCVKVFIVNILSFIRVKRLSRFLCPLMSSHIRWSLPSLSVRWHLIGHAHIIQPILFFHTTWVGSQGYELRKKTTFLFSLTCVFVRHTHEAENRLGILWVWLA